MATPYQNVAKSALMNWNLLSEEEATKKIQTESVQELEGQVYAMGSMKYAVIGIGKEIGLSQDEVNLFFNAVINGPENADIFAIVQGKAQGLSQEQQLGILSTIHDGWVQDNSSEKIFNKKVDKQQLRQYAPLELIGWNEARSDLLFLNPILSSVGVQVDEQELSQAYHAKVSQYMEEMQINSAYDLTTLINQGSAYYPALPQELESRLNPMSEIVSGQIINNWTAKDPESAQIMQSRMQIKKGPKLS